LRVVHALAVVVQVRDGLVHRAGIVELGVLHAAGFEFDENLVDRVGRS
jgi:hypothetical protein